MGLMLKPMQPRELACNAPRIADANGHGRAQRFRWGSLYPAAGSKGEVAR